MKVILFFNEQQVTFEASSLEAVYGGIEGADLAFSFSLEDKAVEKAVQDVAKRLATLGSAAEPESQAEGAASEETVQQRNERLKAKNIPALGVASPTEVDSLSSPVQSFSFQNLIFSPLHQSKLKAFRTTKAVEFMSTPVSGMRMVGETFLSTNAHAFEEENCVENAISELVDLEANYLIKLREAYPDAKLWQGHMPQFTPAPPNEKDRETFKVTEKITAYALTPR
jgi:hypothetical protein